MTKRVNILDKKFGRWTVLSYVGQSRWECQCDCGTIRTVDGSSLRKGISTGCIKCKSGGPLRHGEQRTRLYTIWNRMKGRCNNPNDPAFGRYGGRGIRVCAEWSASYEAFRDWAIGNGYASDLTIDRFPDNDGNYEPGNCRWATPLQQSRNRRNNKPIVFEGETLLISELAERCGIPADVLKNRIRYSGWTIEKAISTPVSFRVIKADIDSPEVDPENAKLAHARREAAFMGKEEGARHIIRSLGKVVTTFEPGSLFAGLEVNLPATASEIPRDPEPAESVDPGQIATEGPEEERPLMEATQPGELEAGETITASARAVSSPALRAPVDPAAVEGASEETRGHAPPAVYSPDPEELERRRALAAVAAGENISPEVTRDLVGIGFLHVTTSRLVVTEEGDAWLRSTAAELSSCV
jgi:hypothetical protein